MTEDSKELLERFVRQRSEAAFRELVRRHSPLVFGTALRKLDGDRAAAQDVTQEVFTLLVRKAAAIEGGGLVNWLYRQACRRASNQLRTERRRKNRELVSATAAGSAGEEHGLDALGGELDDALMSLPSSDREALVLRYFEERDYRALGGSLGITEEAARKRVSRALEKLGAMLKRRGLAIGASSLGTTMSGMGATAVPEGMVSTISAQALKSLPAAGGIAVLPILQSILAGTLFTSLVAGAKLASESTAPPPATAPLVSASPPAFASRAEMFAELPAADSLEAVIEEIKRVQTGPANSLTRLRIAAILERVGIDRIPEFVALGNTRLGDAERSTSYTTLLNRWFKTEPEAVVSFILREKLGEQIDKNRGTNTLNNFFHDWVRQDTAAATAWLMAHWDDPGIGKRAFDSDSLRTFFALNVADEIMSEQGSPPAVLAFIRTLPSPEAQTAVLRGLCGNSGWHQSVLHAGLPKVLEFHRALKALPDDGLRRQLTGKIWQYIGSQRPQEVDALLGTLEPEERFEVKAGLLGVTNKPREGVEMLNGGISASTTPLDDFAEREQAAFEEAAAAGLSRGEAINAMAPVMFERLRGPELLTWVDSHRDDLEIDSLLANQARKVGSNVIDGTPLQSEAIALASRIADPELRLGIARGAFLRILANIRGGASEVLSAYPGSDKLPADLAAEFQKILAEYR